MLAEIINIVSFVANIVEIIVGIFALSVAWTQREKISAAFSILFNYSLQASLSDLHHWLEKLQEYNIEGNDTSGKVRTTLAYISGKIRGNQILKNHLGDKLLKSVRVMIEDLDEGKIVKETTRIAICSEIKERLSSLEVENQNLKTKKYE